MTLMTPEQRYEAKVDRLTTPDGCHLWTAYRDEYGYGDFTSESGKTVRAHKWAYEHYIGPIPEGLECAHGCDNPPCQRIHPDHVHIGTHQDNIDEKVARNRQARVRGETNGWAKLTDPEIRTIRERYANGDITQKQLAQTFGVHQSTIQRIVSGKYWVHL